MANTYHQIFIHLIFAVRNPDAFIRNSFRRKLHANIHRIAGRQGHKLLAVNSMNDHIHLLLAMAPSAVICDVVREIKSFSSRQINTDNICTSRFSWQEGYMAFSYSISQLQAVVEYIDSQKEYHSRISFKQECLKFLTRFNVDYRENYLFDFFDEAVSIRKAATAKQLKFDDNEIKAGASQ